MKHFTFYVLLSMLLFSSCSKNNEEQVALDAPLVYSVSPLEGRPGTIVKIEGENFSRLRVDNKVLFNGVEANMIHFNANTIHVNAPEGSTDGPIAIQIADQSVEGPDFQFIQPPAPTGETVVVKVLSFGAQPWSAAGAHNTQGYLTYYGELAKELDVDFVVGREMDSVTNRSVQVDRPKFFSEQSGLEHYQFSRMIIDDYQGGAFGITVYSKHPIVEQWSRHLGENRVLNVIQAQVTPQSQIAFAGLQVNDVYGANASQIANNQTLRNGQAADASNALNDVMVPLVLAGGLFMADTAPADDPMFRILNQAGFVPGCTTCEVTSVSNNRDIIADFISYRWSRDARVIKYETLDAAPGANRKPVYLELELSL